MSCKSVDLIKFEDLLKKNLEVIEKLIILAEQMGLTDTQMFIDFEDQLNRLSVRNHDFEGD